MQNTVETITLEYPVEYNGEKITVLQMRRPKVRDQVAARKMGSDDAEMEIKLFANLCQVAPVVIEDLDMKDYGKISATFRDFLS